MRKNIDQLFDEFMQECEFVRRVRKETLRGYAQSFVLFKKIIPDLTPETLTVQTVTQFFKTLEQRKRTIRNGKVVYGIMKSTVRTYWSKLYTFFEWLYVHKHIVQNPFRHIRRPSVVWDDIKYLKKESIERIFSALHNPTTTNTLLVKRNLAMFYVLLFCGLRREELLLLQVRDVDIERKMLTVRAENSKIPRTRHIPLHSTALMYVKDYLKERRMQVSAFLFLSKQNKELSMNGLTTIIQSLRKRTGVQFHLHQFRHTFAMNFLKSSNNIVKLKQLMGHSDIRMTLVYLRCMPIHEMRADVEGMRIDDFI